MGVEGTHTQHTVTRIRTVTHAVTHTVTHTVTRIRTVTHAVTDTVTHAVTRISTVTHTHTSMLVLFYKHLQ